MFNHKIASARILLASALVCLYSIHATCDSSAAGKPIPCPKISSRGLNDNGAESYLLFYSPSQRKDVKINYGKDGWTDTKMRNLISSGFDAKLPTLLYSHAYSQSARSGWLLEVRSRFDDVFKRRTATTSFNLIFFDWSTYATKLDYPDAVSAVPQLGKVLGEFLDKLSRQEKYNLDQMHLIGYSLSAHIAGVAARQFPSKVGQITAVDPAGVCVQGESKVQFALKSSDAKLVVARHYDMGQYGARQPIGGIDIFVNGGRDQPIGVHYPDQVPRSKDLFSRISSDHARGADQEGQLLDDECNEVAYECKDFATFLAGECGSCGQNGEKCYYLSNINNMQYVAKGVKARALQSYKLPSNMFISTHFEQPFCLHHYQMVVHLKSDASATAKNLLASNTTTFDFGPHVQVRFANKISDLKFTALETRQTRLTPSQVQKLTILPDGYRTSKVDEDAVKELRRFVDTVEMNYMSHPLAATRAKLSYKLCSDASKQLVKC